MIADAPNARPASGIASVDFDDVHFTYPDTSDISLESLEPAALPAAGENDEVLRGISFTVEPGKTLALVGPSGAGKTTITHLVARLYDATTGSVRIGGDDVKDLSAASLQENLGYVTQDAHMFHDSVRANMEYAKPGATEAQMWQAMESAHIADLVRRLPQGIDTIVGERGYRLSGGERQRLAIARLLLKSPAIVVLDEATAHLDSESEAAVQRALDSAMEERTSIVIAHRLSTVRAADEILVIADGRVVERGRHEELLAANGLYKELYTTQFGDA
ncbi:acetyl-CoA acetyltransferase [Platysternon megacephalum]|uniref:Acetyl-CoA acetyltransferase n=1 Tax=Platysternon megacephalum TaxID=55544 RepID=A0A4D9DEQ2_9SAUR|nr:acetyl-CoA acetyltransferase [Platysternon megacephalum]